MQPGVVLRGDVGQSGDVVDRARVGRARDRHDGQGHDTGRDVGLDGAAQRRDVDLLPVVHRDQRDAGPPEPEDARGLEHAVVHLDAAVDAPRREAAQPVAGRVVAESLVRPLAGRAESDQVGDRTAAGEHALHTRRQGAGLGQPAKGDLLEQVAGVAEVALGAGEGRGEPRDGGDHRGPGGYPAPEARRRHAHGVGQHGVAESCERRLRTGTPSGKGSVEHRPPGGVRAGHAPCRRCLQVLLEGREDER